MNILNHKNLGITTGMLSSPQGQQPSPYLWLFKDQRQGRGYWLMDNLTLAFAQNSSANYFDEGGVIK